MSIDHLLALSGVMPSGASGWAYSIRQMTRAGYLFSFVRQSAIATLYQRLVPSLPL